MAKKTYIVIRENNTGNTEFLQIGGRRWSGGEYVDVMETSKVSEAKKFAKTHKAKVVVDYGLVSQETVEDYRDDKDKILDIARQEKWPEDALDEMVHDICQEGSLEDLNAEENDEVQEDFITLSEQAASEINNKGLEGQVEFLIEEGCKMVDIIVAGRSAKT